MGFSFERMDDNVSAYLGGGTLGRRFAFLYMRWCYDSMFDVHLAASDYTAAELRATARQEQTSRTYVQPPGLESTQFDPERRSNRLRQELLRFAVGSSETVLLLYVGRISPEKNIQLLVDVISKLAVGPGDYRLIVAGSGPLRDSLERAATTLERGRIVLWGQVQDRDALAALYATCDVFVHPNPREPFGIAPLEAMASGCPVVVPDSGGVLTYADASNAWLATPNAEAFAAAIRSAHADQDSMKRRIERARATAVRFDTRRMVHELFETYRELREPSMAKRDTITTSHPS